MPGLVLLKKRMHMDVCLFIRHVTPALLDVWPEAVKEKDWYESTPLHVACYREEPLEVVSVLLKGWPGAAKKKDAGGRVPLHSLCENFLCEQDASLEVVFALLTAWPDAVSVREDNFDETPLQRVCSIRTPLEVVTSLLNTWLSYKDNRTNRAILSLQEDALFCTGYVEMLFTRLFAICNNNTDHHTPKEIMDYFICIQLWNGTTLVLDRNPTVIKAMGLDTKVMADFLSRVGRCCSLKAMWGVLYDEQNLLAGI
eukprot:6775343-Ditylum_brightwellii.AAC.1